MKTLQEHYNAIKTGKGGNKAQFLKQARQLFPEYINQYSDFDTATNVLKSKQIISEANAGGVVSKGFDIFDWKKILAEEAKAEEKNVSKEVEDYGKSNFNNKDMKNADNINFNEIMKGFYAELKDAKNHDKTGDELKAIVIKNLAKDPLYYTKDGEFGVKGIGYTTEAPGLGEPKEPKGKHKSSGYGDLDADIKVEKVKANVQDSLGDREAKTSDPKKVKEMTTTPQNSAGVKKMKMPGAEKTIKLQEGKIPAENRNTYYYVKLAKDMKEDGKSKEEIRQFFKDEEVDSKLVDTILADIFLKLKEGIENKTYAVYELYFGRPYNFYNEEKDKFIWSEPTEATLYTKEEAENKRKELLKPRVDYYQETGRNYKEIHVGDLFEKGILKEAMVQGPIVNPKGGGGGEKKAPRAVFLSKEVVDQINTKFPGSIKLVSKGKNASMFISQLFAIALGALSRGRYSPDTERKKPELAKFAADLIPSLLRSKIKSSMNPKPTQVGGEQMHYIELNLVPKNDGSGYWIPLKGEFDPLVTEAEQKLRSLISQIVKEELNEGANDWDTLFNWLKQFSTDKGEFLSKNNISSGIFLEKKLTSGEVKVEDLDKIAKKDGTVFSKLPVYNRIK